MHEIENLEVGTDIIEENSKEAEEVNEYLSEKGIISIDLVGAIGSGKTSIIEEFSNHFEKLGAIVGDVSGEDDYKRLKNKGIDAVNLNTGKECHLDAHLVKHALEDLSLSEIDLLFFENVGNLVCPADFELGSDYRWVIVSVTEGDDVINKHPLIFKEADAVIINKIDLSDAIGADVEKMVNDAKEIDPNLDILKTSFKKDEGIVELLDLI